MSLSSRPGTTQARNTCYRAARSLGSQHVISCLPRTSIHEVGRWACQAILSEISAHSLWLMMVLPHSPGPGTLRHHVRGTSVGCLPKRCINKKVRLAASVSRPQVIHRVRLSHLRGFTLITLSHTTPKKKGSWERTARGRGHDDLVVLRGVVSGITGVALVPDDDKISRYAAKDLFVRLGCTF